MKISVRRLLNYCAVSLYPYQEGDIQSSSFDIKSYADDIVVFTCTFHEVSATYLGAFRVDGISVYTNDCVSLTQPQIFYFNRLPSTKKLFVLQNSLYLYFGTHSVRGASGHHEWVIDACNLKTREDIFGVPIRLRDFAGSDFGTTCNFTLHGDHFYALTNQTHCESPETDWTSHYHYIRFPLGEKFPDTSIHTIWRRQHCEGPIHDAWTNLGFDVDEQTGELLIVEYRKERLGGGTICTRTSYIVPFERSVHADVQGMNTIPLNDPLSKTTNDHRPECFPSWRRSKYTHSEYPPTTPAYDSHPNTQDYLRSKTQS